MLCGHLRARVFSACSNRLLFPGFDLEGFDVEGFDVFHFNRENEQRPLADRLALERKRRARGGGTPGLGSKPPSRPRTAEDPERALLSASDILQGPQKGRQKQTSQQKTF